MLLDRTHKWKWIFKVALYYSLLVSIFIQVVDFIRNVSSPDHTILQLIIGGTFAVLIGVLILFPFGILSGFLLWNRENKKSVNE
ncbi:hypothetical protein WAK64_19780 [Bacillus spongiae]|uniref:DUF3923 family protein n=1 Tax=Bacillus spongiae TaxID=2683610 RepID=A0ABU8HJM2_9BACI